MSISETISKKIDSIASELTSLSDYIHDNPELGFEEYRSSKALVEVLRNYGFAIELPFVDLPTAFRATFKGKETGPRVAFLAEYDALPGIGHGCGHNMIGAACVGAAIGLSEALKTTGGSVDVLGCPAEETSGAKVDMVEKKVFDGYDFAMSVHPSDKNLLSSNSLALDALEFTYHGKAAHAAVAPEKGINALNAVIALFNHVDALRQHVRSDVRIHGIISEGGVAPNIVPERATARFYIRAKDRIYLNEVVGKVNNCAKAAALATGTTLEVKNFENSFDEMIANRVLKKIAGKRVVEQGETIEEPGAGAGSTDVGNVSHAVPTVSISFRAAPKGTLGHTREFAEQMKTDLAHAALIKASKILALSALDVMVDSAMLERAKKELAMAIRAR